MAKALAILGTMSSVGKSFLTALLAHHFAEKGVRVFPFKAQNMSLNAFATVEGEMAYAQAFQAWAAGREPSVHMNPLLLKPMGNLSSEVIFLGKSQGILPSQEFRRFKSHYKLKVFKVFEEVLSKNELVIIEGAGSLAELNLLQDDFVNYEIVKQYQLPFILVGDIDRGGVFAQIWGTYELVPELKDLSLGFVINKFRGAEGLFQEGIKILEEKTQKPCLGLLPYLPESLFEEDSASLGMPKGSFTGEGLKIAIVYYPHISNYLDFDPLKAEEVEVILTDDPSELRRAHVIILPGSKNTLASLKYLENRGLARVIREISREKIILGICGGFQLLGRLIKDEGVENQGEEKALGLLPHETIFFPEKIATSRRINIKCPFFQGKIRGFEIRYGRSFLKGEEVFFLHEENIFGTYLHGLFYDDLFRHCFLNYVRDLFGLPQKSFRSFKNYLREKLQAVSKERAFADFFQKVEEKIGAPL